MIATEQIFKQEFERRMKEHRLWSHPFFTVVRDDSSLYLLQQWAIQAGKIDEVFAEILTSMLDNPNIPRTMHPPIQRNLADELGHGHPEQEHFALFRNVLQVVDVSEAQYHKTPATLGTASIINSLRQASRSANPLRILGMMASEELICPREFPLFLETMLAYGNETDLRYFYEHIEADVGHSSDLIQLGYLAANGNRQRLEQLLHRQNVDLENNVLFYDDLMRVIPKRK